MPSPLGCRHPSPGERARDACRWLLQEAGRQLPGALVHSGLIYWPIPQMWNGTMMDSETTCPCECGLPYAEHCQKIHVAGAGLGVSAEQLMRARYSAYVLHLRPFLLESWHPDTRPVALEFDQNIEWIGLEIVDTVAGGALDTSGVVEFRARFTRSGEPLELHERSSFAQVDGRWLYIDGE